MAKNNKPQQEPAEDAVLTEVTETVSSKKKKRGKNAVADSVGQEGASNRSQTPATPAAEASKKYKYVIQNRKVRKHSRKRALAIAMLIFIGSTIVLGALVYGISLFVQYNNLKILVDKPGANVFSLSSSASFEVGTEVLSLGGPRYMDNTSIIDFYNRIPDIKNTEGAYRPDDIKFLAATVYFKNVTGKQQLFSYAVALDEVTQNLDEAMRVMLIKNDDIEVYAKAKPGTVGGSPYETDAIPEQVAPGQMFGEGGAFVDSDSKAWMAQPFLNPRYALYKRDNVVESGETIRFTILVWLEGWDADCVDDRLGGTVRVQLQFSQS